MADLEIRQADLAALRHPKLREVAAAAAWAIPYLLIARPRSAGEERFGEALLLPSATDLLALRDGRFGLVLDAGSGPPWWTDVAIRGDDVSALEGAAIEFLAGSRAARSWSRVP